MIDRFVMGLGLLDNNGSDFDDSVLLVLQESAEAFLRAGGHLTLSEWEGLGAASRGAFVVGGNRIARERAVLSGLASSSQAMAAQILAANDGGEMQIQQALAQALDAAEARIQDQGQGGGA